MLATRSRIREQRKDRHNGGAALIAASVLGPGPWGHDVAGSLTLDDYYKILLLLLLVFVGWGGSVRSFRHQSHGAVAKRYLGC
jgi:hypothetical protein